MIVAGEQESLGNTDDDSVVPDAGETARTEQTLNPTTYASGYDTTDFQRGTRRVDVESSTNPNPNPHNWHTQGHSREFHLRHPNMPDPFEKPQQHHNSQYPYHQHQHHHHHHPHHHHEHEHQHSRRFHSLHPNLPNPFEEKPKQEVEPEPEPEPEQEPKQEQEPEVEEFLPNPNAEATTPHNFEIQFRSGFNEPCEFNCGSGKCAKLSEVCDGVNNCGNRKDELQCDHLGYELRLTGGDSPHMGRVEVKGEFTCPEKAPN